MAVSPERVGLGMGKIDQTGVRELGQNLTKTAAIPFIAVGLPSAPIFKKPAFLRHGFEQRVLH